jgi:hypothetical protein
MAVVPSHSAPAGMHHTNSLSAPPVTAITYEILTFVRRFLLLPTVALMSNVRWWCEVTPAIWIVRFTLGEQIQPGSLYPFDEGARSFETCRNTYPWHNQILNTRGSFDSMRVMWQDVQAEIIEGMWGFYTKVGRCVLQPVILNITSSYSDVFSSLSILNITSSFQICSAGCPYLTLPVAFRYVLQPVHTEHYQ